MSRIRPSAPPTTLPILPYDGSATAALLDRARGSPVRQPRCAAFSTNQPARAGGAEAEGPGMAKRWTPVRREDPTEQVPPEGLGPPPPPPFFCGSPRMDLTLDTNEYGNDEYEEAQRDVEWLGSMRERCPAAAAAAAAAPPPPPLRRRHAFDRWIRSRQEARHPEKNLWCPRPLHVAKWFDATADTTSRGLCTASRSR